MALFTRKSGNVIIHVRANIASLSIRSFTSCISTSIKPFFNSPSSNIVRNALFITRRFESINAGKQLKYHVDNNQELDFPGGKVAFTYKMSFISESAEKRIPFYRLLDNNGQHIKDGDFVEVSKEVATKMYEDMVTLQTMDTVFYETQRQGKISFYATATGEEAIIIASAAALTIGDVVVPQYREPGVLLWRGFTLQEFANQCFSNQK